MSVEGRGGGCVVRSAATEKHSEITKDALMGQGVDRCVCACVGACLGGSVMMGNFVARVVGAGGWGGHSLCVAGTCLR